ncbi:MAG: hypothetical protein LBB85_01620 [Dysgonamonadaceae bacterium]|nr:hypothetical protein [Dysgonamonadaceae bacterium]
MKRCAVSLLCLWMAIPASAQLSPTEISNSVMNLPALRNYLFILKADGDTTFGVGPYPIRYRLYFIFLAQ